MVLEMYWRKNVSMDDVVDFIQRRLSGTLNVDGVRVVNFNIHRVDADALRRVAGEVSGGVAVIPYNMAAAWTRFVQLFPTWFANVDMLYYDQSRGRYVVVPPIGWGVLEEYRGIVGDLVYRYIGWRPSGRGV